MRDFRRWLAAEAPDLFVEVGLSLAEYLIAREQPEAAVELLARLPDEAAPETLYRQSVLRGNAYLRMPGKVKDALRHLEDALQFAHDAELPSPDRQRLIGGAHKELGYYYRNAGRWRLA